MDTSRATTAITRRMRHTATALRGRHQRPFTRALLLAMLVVGVLAARYAVPVQAAHIVPPGVPAAIAVPSGNTAYLLGHATGTQNYTCTSASAWGSAVPAATLVDNKGKQIATHYAGPTWQAKDGSTVLGTKLAAATVDSTAIPWLLVQAASTALGPDGGNRLVNTTYIQRVNTTSGLAPAGNCTPGATASIPYTADYYFFQAAEQ